MTAFNRPLQGQIPLCFSPADVTLTNQTLSTDPMWPTGTHVLVKGTLTINASVTFNNISFEMAPNARIFVETAGTVVTCRNNTAFYGCTYLWSGMILRNGAAVDIDNCYFEDAKIAFQINNTANDGISVIKNTKFNDCLIGISASNFTAANILQFKEFSGNFFLRTMGTMLPSTTQPVGTDPTKPYKAISLTNCVANFWTNTLTRNTIKHYRYGIWVAQSSLVVANFWIESTTDGTEEYDGSGIYAYQSILGVGGLGTTNCTFRDNPFAGVVSNQTLRLSVNNATFRMNSTSVFYGVYSAKNNSTTPLFNISDNTFEMASHKTISAIYVERPPGAGEKVSTIARNTVDFSANAKDVVVIIDVVGTKDASDQFNIERNTIHIATPFGNTAPKARQGIRITGKGEKYQVIGDNTIDYTASNIGPVAAANTFGIIARDLSGSGHSISNNTVIGKAPNQLEKVGTAILGHDIKGNAFFCENTVSNTLFGMRMSDNLANTLLKTNIFGNAQHGLRCQMLTGMPGMTIMPDQGIFENIWPANYAVSGATYADGTTAPFFFFFDNDNVLLNDKPSVVIPTSWFVEADGSHPQCGVNLNAAPPLSDAENALIQGNNPPDSDPQGWDKRRNLFYKLLRYPSLSAGSTQISAYINSNLYSSAYQHAYADFLYDEAYRLGNTEQAQIEKLNKKLAAYWYSMDSLQLLQANNTVYDPALAHQSATLFAQSATSCSALESRQNNNRASIALKLQNVLAYTQGLPSGSTHESNHRTVLGIAVREAKGDSLTNMDYTDLRYVANQCPLTGGEVVSWAPFWLPHGEGITYLKDSLRTDCIAPLRPTSGRGFVSTGFIAPNPVTDMANITVPDYEMGIWQIADIAGKIIQNDTWSQAKEVFTIDTQQWPNGIFILTFKPEGQVSASLKLIVSH